jgi:hypothetical protein
MKPKSAERKTPTASILFLSCSFLKQIHFLKTVFETMADPKLINTEESSIRSDAFVHSVMTLGILTQG